MTALQRTLTARSLVVYYVSSVVGAGILVVPGVAAQIAGPASLVGWLLLSAVAYPFAIVFARMSSTYPDSGGVAYLLRRAAGPRVGDTAGVVLLVINLVGNPVLGLAAARYLLTALGVESQPAVLWVGLALMAAAVGVNALGLRIGAPVQTALVAVLVVGIVAVIGVSLPHAEASNLRPFAPNGWGAVGGALVASFFSFMGWENVSHVADEVIDGARSYIRAARVAVVMIATLYTLLALAVVSVTPPATVGGETAVVSALLEVAAGPAAARVGGVLGFMVLFLAAIAWILGASRLTYAVSRSGLIDRRVATVGRRTGVPHRALLVLLCGYTVTITALALLGRDEQALIVVTSTVMLLVYLAAFAAGLRLFDDPATRVAAGVALCAALAFLAMGGRFTLLVLLAVWLVHAGVRRRSGAARARATPDPD